MEQDLLRSKGLLHDIVFVQLGLNVLERNIAKFGQPDLNERVVGCCNTLKRCESNLVCQAVGGLGGAWFDHDNVGISGAELLWILQRTSFALRAVVLSLLLGRYCTLRTKGCECDVAGIEGKEYSTPATSGRSVKRIVSEQWFAFLPPLTSTGAGSTVEFATVKHSNAEGVT